jgi:hypothetical protein
MTLPVPVEGTWLNPGEGNPDQVSLDAGELRLADATMFAGDGDEVAGGIARHGTDSLRVSVDGSDVVTIKAGSVVIPGNAVSGTGPYRCGMAQDATGSLAPRDATNGRVDLVVARQLDDDVVNTHNAYRAEIGTILTGAATGSPTPVALPDMAVELGRINVPHLGGGPATVDLTHVTYATALGGILAVPTFARLPTTAAKRQKAVTLDDGLEYSFDGSDWNLPIEMNDFNPVWGSTGSTPNKGTGGTLTGKWSDDGLWIDYEFTLTIGTTPTPGSAGVYTISLPVTAAAAQNGGLSGGCSFFDTSAGNYFPLTAYRTATGGGNTVAFITSGGNRWGPSAPAAPAAGDVISGTIRYRKA